MIRPCSSNTSVFRCGPWPLVWIFLALSLLVWSGAATEVRTAASSWRNFGDSLRSARPHLIAAAVARFASISAGYPLDAIKTRLQVGGGAAAAMSLPDMYRGLGSSLFGQVPYGVLTFGTYEVYKTALMKRFPQLPRVIAFGAAAILGDMTGSFWLLPAEVVKVQIQGGLHASIAEATLSIFKTSGVGGFYQGFSGQLGCDVPFRAIQLTSYELLRARLGTWRKRQQQQQQQAASSLAAATATGGNTNSNNNNNDGAVRARGGAAAAAGVGAGGKKSKKISSALSAGDDALLGGVAGAISATFTCPMDVIRTRLMVGGDGGGGAAAETWASAIKAGRLFSGLGTRVFYIGTSSALFFVVYEATKNRPRRQVVVSPPTTTTTTTAVAVGKEQKRQH